ncbi:type VI secretion system baseplate subunit TssG [Pseudoalteromonas denitrificans]|uniref:Type VI secretion protein, VC_A0111 family n=1 Tax=Pseudoalteromonas denitrificans DSM 6059 TaxID=1123010 RepID=A0A1I1NDR8_9GAMM|nr:type VI secretion system baseplate subunit TssG [Pseudoalteromonas denitrificans]SFC95821.1 type VI secretion protein, VC_A0111 family [Pseudoalteromonas denitrificans DSM 6059]
MSDHLQAQPIWSKLPEPIEALIAKPWCFSLFNAMYAIEKNWAMPLEMCSGLSERIMVSPNHALNFNASEVKSCDLHNTDRGVLSLKSNFLGLYGADSPMPHYVLEQCDQNTPAGKRTRAFLDIFNHIFYCQMYQAWKKNQLCIQGIGAKQYDEVLNAILSGNDERIYNTGVASVKQTSASGLAQMLRIEMHEPSIKVEDLGTSWMALDEISILGNDESNILGLTAILGEQVLVSGADIQLHIGPITQTESKHFSPFEVKSKKLATLMKSHLPQGIAWQCLVKIKQPEHSEKRIGQDEIRLGYNSNLGFSQSRIEKLSFDHAQYK